MPIAVAPSAGRLVCSACRQHLSRRLRARLSPRDDFFGTRFYSSHQRTRPFRLAIIGSGPAGFYTAYRVMQKIPGSRVDMYEKLPVPFGLVRYGVAPDHPEVKNCQDKFEEIASSDRFTFIGNISVGTELPLSSLIPHYDAICFTYGASEDRRLNIPGEDKQGIYSARAFVGWYNGLPEYASLDVRLDAGDTAVVIGQGNVALDVARVLLSDVAQLGKTDMAQHALDALSQSRIKNVHVIGRRGPMQAAFTIKELRELLTLPETNFKMADAVLPADAAELKALPRQQRRIAELLRKYEHGSIGDFGKKFELDFMLTPRGFSGDSHVEGVEVHRNSYAEGADPMSRGASTHELLGQKSFSMPARSVFRSVGYKSLPLPGLSEIGVPFDDQRGIIPNDAYGRILAPPEALGATGAPLPVPQRIPGMYCAGWVKRGPTGVIASTMEDAFATGDAIAQDYSGGEPMLHGGAEGWSSVKNDAIKLGLRGTSWADWRAIDTVERERGRAKGKEREKTVSIADMLKLLGG